MKILSIDIETSPNLAHVWGLWDQNVGLNQLMEATEMLCFAAKWVGERKTYFYSVHHDGKEAMVRAAYDLLDEADVVLHFNGRHFDVPHLNREFIALGYEPPSPFKQVDLLEVVKKQFKFPSNKLAYVSKALGLEGKVQHEGHELWVKCMAGDRRAWATMKKYNIQDTVLNEELYFRLLPWIPNHPSFGAFTGEDVCPNCGGDNLQPRGYALTMQSQFQRFKCRDCGKWSRSTKRVGGTKITQISG